MNDYSTSGLIRDFFSRPFTNNLKTRFGQWLLTNQLKEEKEQAMLSLWNEENVEADTQTFEDLAEIHVRINKNVRKSFRLSMPFQIAAAIVLLLIGSFSTYLLTNTSKNETTKMLQCFVRYGERKSIVLPDGSQAFLNAGSLLVYPEKFTSTSRTIYLSGEAEFTVKKNKRKPFIVKTNHVDVQALGTIFTVTAYPGDSITEAMLEQGCIQVDVNKKVPETRKLKPNELLSYSHKTEQICIKSIDALQAAKWKQGYLIFKAATLGEIFTDMERRYNIKIFYNQQNLGSGIYNIKFMPNETVEQNLAILKELVKGFDYKIRNSTVCININ